MRTTPRSSGAIVASFDLSPAAKARDESFNQTLVMGLAVLVFGTFVAFLIGRTLAGPVNAMRAIAEEIAAGNLQIEQIQKGSFEDELAEMGRSFNEMVFVLRDLSAKATQVAEGDLGVRIEARGDLADAFRGMLSSLQRLVREIAETSTRVNSSATEILASAKQLDASSQQQAGAMAETHRTMETLLAAAQQIAEQAQEVYSNADKTLENNKLIAERISTLATQNQKISEILEVIKDIADKSDILALNASLEGTKAGEAGRGFALVAAEMRALAENVMEAVKDVRTLTSDIRESSEASVLATEAGMKLADETTDSAKRISLITQQQQSGTEQVNQSVDQVTELLMQSTQGAREVTNACEELTELSRKLSEMVETFVVDGGRGRRA